MNEIAPTIKVLFLEANPETMTHLHTNREIRHIKEILRKARYRDHIEINQLGAVRTIDFTEELKSYKPRIVHFSGHGKKSAQLPEFVEGNNVLSFNKHDAAQQIDAYRGLSSSPEEELEKTRISQGGIVFEEEILEEDNKGRNESGSEPESSNDENTAKKQIESKPKIVHRVVPPEEVASFFQDLDPPVECVVLNGCHTEETANQVSRYVPFVIGMSDEILDNDAINFSKYFYQALGQGCSIEIAFTTAKKHSNTPFPELKRSSKVHPLPYYDPRWILAGSLVSAILVILFRIFGNLQGFEINFFDYLQTFWRQRDDRILIVHANNDDVRFQQQRGEQVTGSFSNQTLATLLSKISALEPAVIGLDIYRENELDSSLPEEKELQNHFRQNNVFGVCLLPDVREGGQGGAAQVVVKEVPPPPDLSIDRIGFSDISVDKDIVVRRQLLGGFTDNLRGRQSCNTNESFSLKLANSYLKSQNLMPITLDNSDNKICRINLPNGKTIEGLHPFTGGYQGDSRIIGGCQVLLRYRMKEDGNEQNDNTLKPAEMFTVQEVLDDELESKYVKDKVVLIGVTRTDGYREYWNTPYNVIMGSQMSGVMLQAQMTSQLLDAALGKSRLIWVLPFWGEWLWIILWASVGGIIVWRFQLSATRIGALIIAVGTGFGICFIVFQAASGWLPFVPVAIVLIAAPFGSWLVDLSRIELYKARKSKR